MKEIEYIEINGLLYPKLTLPPQKEIHLTRFGRKRLQYLKQYRPIFYTNLLLNNIKLKEILLKNLKKKIK